MNRSYRSEQPDKVYQKLVNNADVQLVDVRSHAEFNNVHAKGAISIPLDKISREVLENKIGTERLRQHTLYFICESGLRAQQAVDRLKLQGVDNVALVDGGTSEWEKQQLPVKRISRLPSLERQTQIAIGGILLLVLAKGMLIHPLFHALTGFIAIGLIIAGVTARCTLSALLARMPWNQVRQKEAA